jgi:hypothetical protein
MSSNQLWRADGAVKVEETLHWLDLGERAI